MNHLDNTDEQTGIKAKGESSNLVATKENCICLHEIPRKNLTLIGLLKAPCDMRRP